MHFHFIIRVIIYLQLVEHISHIVFGALYHFKRPVIVLRIMF